MPEISNIVSTARRASLLCSLLLATCCALYAQPDGPPPGDPPLGMQGDAPRGPSVERQLKRMTETLSLNETQQAQVKALLTEQRQQMEALHKSMQAEDSQDPAAGREKSHAIRNDTNAKISALLNDDQKAKFTAMLQRRGRHGDGPPPDGAGGPPPGL